MRIILCLRHPTVPVGPPAPELPTISVPAAYNAWLDRRMKLTGLVVFGVPLLLLGLVVGWWIVRASRARSA